MQKALFVLVLLATFAVPAQAQSGWCSGFRSTYFVGPVNDTLEVSGRSETSLFGSAMAGAQYGNTCAWPWYQEANGWVEGRQPNRPWDCVARVGFQHAANESVYGICSSYRSEGGATGITMVYQHGSVVDGWWGFTSRHAWNETISGNIYVSRQYSYSLAYECGQRGQPWYWDGGNCQDGGGSPILLPLRSNREDTHAFYRLTAPAVYFDLDGDGDRDFVGWTAPGSNLAFLAMDRNGNGTIDDGRELFGNFTLPGAANGFAALALSEGHADDGRQSALDGNDPLYAQLLLWEDRNSDAISQPHELTPLSDIYASIGLGYSYDPTRIDAHGNKLAVEGWAEVRTGPGLNRAASATEHHNRLRRIYDVFFIMR